MKYIVVLLLIIIGYLMMTDRNTKEDYKIEGTNVLYRNDRQAYDGYK